MVAGADAQGRADAPGRADAILFLNCQDLRPSRARRNLHADIYISKRTLLQGKANGPE
jgi:hypothetical protein